MCGGGALARQRGAFSLWVTQPVVIAAGGGHELCFPSLGSRTPRSEARGQGGRPLPCSALINHALPHVRFCNFLQLTSRHPACRFAASAGRCTDSPGPPPPPTIEKWYWWYFLGSPGLRGGPWQRSRSSPQLRVRCIAPRAGLALWPREPPGRCVRPGWVMVPSVQKGKLRPPRVQ